MDYLSILLARYLGGGSGGKTLSSISAVYTQGGTVYDTDSLDSLKSDLVVTATYDDSSTETVLAYTLSGTLTVGTSTITVSYGGQTTTFTVTVTTTFNYGVYTPDSVVRGSYIAEDGTITAAGDNSGYFEDYISTIRGSYWISYQNAPYSANWASLANWRVSEYDADKNFIKQTHYTGSANTQYMSRTHTFDADTKYIRLGWYDGTSTTSVPSFDIENPTTFTELPMEAGDINSSTGADSTSSVRIRTDGYIPAGESVTFTGCPYASSWSDFTTSTTFAFGYRCYDGNDTYLGSANGSDIFNGSATTAMQTGTEKIRFIMQRNTSNYPAFQYLVNRLIDIDGTKYYIVEV